MILFIGYGNNRINMAAQTNGDILPCNIKVLGVGGGGGIYNL